MLIRPVSKDEVKQALMGINDNKAPGCDGFNAHFFKKLWILIGEEVTHAVLQFFETTEIYRAINCTVITLIPKIKNPSSVKEFLPISCCTILYKVISKILTTRMQEVMDAIIDNSQSAFVPGRLIMDNIVMSHELVKAYGRKGISPLCMIKVDMQKAYDSVEWSYIEQVMQLLGFPQFFLKWIMSCITSVSYTVMINGVATKPFQAKKGLRQGDHLSPFLFVMAMEYLSRSLQSLTGVKGFKFHPRCAKLNVTH